MISRLTNNVLSVYDVSAQELKFDSDGGTAIDQLSITNDDITAAIKALTIDYRFGDTGDYTLINLASDQWVLPTEQNCIDNAAPTKSDIFDDSSEINGSWPNFTTNFGDDTADHRTGSAAPPRGQGSITNWNHGSSNYPDVAYSTTNTYWEGIRFRCGPGGAGNQAYGDMYAKQYTLTQWGDNGAYNDFGNYSNTAWLNGHRSACMCYFSTNKMVGSATISSDRRIKKNFVPIENAMESIDKINIVQYDKYLSFDKKGIPTKDIGVIAQEIMSSNDPNLLKSLCIINDIDEPEKYLINYDILFCLTIKAFQELHDEYEKFKEEKNKKLLHLMERITALENKKNI